MGNSIRLWTKREVAFLRENYNKIPIKSIAIILGRTENAVKIKGCSLKLKERVWSEKDTQYLRDNYRNTSNRILARVLNKSLMAINCKAFFLGLRKKNKNTHWSPEQDKVMLDMVSRKVETRRIAHRLGKDYHAVYRRIKRLKRLMGE